MFRSGCVSKLSMVVAVTLLIVARARGRSCDEQADERWAAALNLRTCDSANTLTLAEVVGNSTALQALADQFDVEPMSASEAQCLLNNQKQPAVTANLQACVPLLAPPVNATGGEKRLASLGLMHEPTDGKLVSMCKPSMPCKEFNKFLANGSLAASAHECGALKPLVKALASWNMQQTIAEGFLFQNSDTGRTDNCYCTRKDGRGIRGPVFGPIYYVNAKLIYLLGGLEALGRMPGCRVLCPAGNATSTCDPTPPLWNLFM